MHVKRKQNKAGEGKREKKMCAKHENSQFRCDFSLTCGYVNQFMRFLSIDHVEIDVVSKVRIQSSLITL